MSNNYNNNNIKSNDDTKSLPALLLLPINDANDNEKKRNKLTKLGRCDS